MKPEECVDVVIVGAGWHGLIMAKTYLEANPYATLLLLDASPTLGGTWSFPRLYPSLKTNNVLGSYEFSDFPMDGKRYSHLFPSSTRKSPARHIPGEVVYRYLEDFAKHFRLFEKIRSGVKVEEAVLGADGEWTVGWKKSGDVYKEKEHQEEKENEDQETVTEGRIHTKKLIIATGLTSTPHIPTSPSTTPFAGNILHSIQLKKQSHILVGSKSVVVIGGNKSAWDVCYAAATAGAKVHMVMRPSGGGPSWVWPGVSGGPSRGPLKLMGKNTSLARLSLLRVWTWFDPNPFVQDSFGKLARYFLHQTWMGRLICALFWAMLDRVLQKANGYYGDSGDENLRMLRPWTSTFWMGNSLSVHNYETDFFELVKQGKITVHHADLESFGEKTVQLGDGDCLEADTVVFCTGWKSAPSIKFGPPGIEREIGLPGYEYESSYSAADQVRSTGFGIGMDDKELNILKAEVKEQILRESPILASKPVRNLPVSKRQQEKQKRLQQPQKEVLNTSTPYRLYNHIAPPGPTFLHNRNLAFIGHHRSIHASLVAQAQALWITAFFAGHIDLPSLPHHPLPTSQETLLSKTYYQGLYQALRHPPSAGGSGNRFPDMVFDSLPYIDMLLGECGVNAMRKGTWWKNVFEVYSLRDYRGLVPELLDVIRDKERRADARSAAVSLVEINGNGKV